VATDDVEIRPATVADRERLGALYRAFFAESPPPPYAGIELEDELRNAEARAESGIAVVAEAAGELVGYAFARRKRGTDGELSELYVRKDVRRRGIGAALVRAVAAGLREQGVTHVTLSVDVDSPDARAVYRKWGFRERVLQLVCELDELERRVAGGRGPSFGSVHVQTDDRDHVVQAAEQYVRRLGRSAGTVVSQPRNGWIAVYDELCDRDPAALRKLARELSDRRGSVVVAIGVEEDAVVRYVLFERGQVMDEYLSVPEYFATRPSGEVVSLAANPTLAARLTGADPARVRRVARTASSPAELPPARELVAEVAAALGLEGGEHGYTDARRADATR
jgi:ribosomal protein S18 acetylase RimI-like enzyme